MIFLSSSFFSLVTLLFHCDEGLPPPLLTCHPSCPRFSVTTVMSYAFFINRDLCPVGQLLSSLLSIQTEMSNSHLIQLLSFFSMLLQSHTHTKQTVGRFLVFHSPFFLFSFQLSVDSTTLVALFYQDHFSFRSIPIIRLYLGLCFSFLGYSPGWRHYALRVPPPRWPLLHFHLSLFRLLGKKSAWASSKLDG